MKIGMTESKAMSGFFAGWQGEREEGVQFFRSTMALLGVEFEPEEPELPERISADSLRVLGDPPITQALRAEAARRFNAWGKLRKWLREHYRNWSTLDPADILNKLDSLLSEED